MTSRSFLAIADGIKPRIVCSGEYPKLQFGKIAMSCSVVS